MNPRTAVPLVNANPGGLLLDVVQTIAPSPERPAGHGLG
jgi:hypothetical protein